jgi:hypothetical protein
MEILGRDGDAFSFYGFYGSWDCCEWGGDYYVAVGNVGYERGEGGEEVAGVGLRFIHLPIPCYYWAAHGRLLERKTEKRFGKR